MLFSCSQPALWEMTRSFYPARLSWPTSASTPVSILQHGYFAEFMAANTASAVLVSQQSDKHPYHRQLWAELFDRIHKMDSPAVVDPSSTELSDLARHVLEENPQVLSHH